MISVVVPYRNANDWLRRCALSLHKTDGDFEFIFVDDFSCDMGYRQVEYISDAAHDRRFRLLTNDHCAGVSGARNTGIEHAHGEWITFLDADDAFSENAPRAFEHLISCADGYNIIQLNHLRHYKKSGRTVNKYHNFAGVYTSDSLPECWCMVWNKLYRASFLKDIRFVEGLQYGEDEIFNLECLAKDDRILHGTLNDVAIVRHFDNKKSLSRIKDRAGLLAQSRALEDFIERTESDSIRAAARRVLAEHWSSATYMKAFGE